MRCQHQSFRTSHPPSRFIQFIDLDGLRRDDLMNEFRGKREYPLENQLRDAGTLHDSNVCITVVEEESLDLTVVLFPWLISLLE